MLHFFSSKRIVVVAVTPGMVKVFKSELCFIQPRGELLNSVYFCHKAGQKRLAPGRFNPFFETLFNEMNAIYSQIRKKPFLWHYC